MINLIFETIYGDDISTQDIRNSSKRESLRGLKDRNAGLRNWKIKLFSYKEMEIIKESIKYARGISLQTKLDVILHVKEKNVMRDRSLIYDELELIERSSSRTHMGISYRVEHISLRRYERRYAALYPVSLSEMLMQIVSTKGYQISVKKNILAEEYSEILRHSLRAYLDYTNMVEENIAEDIINLLKKIDVLMRR